MKVSDLRKKAAPYNPRKISEKQNDMLNKAMSEFGDLSGVVLNTQTGRIIGGHQRLNHLDSKAKIVKEPHTDEHGTVAIGYIETDKGRWVYREVDWPERKEKAANVAANKHGGDWDFPMLADLLQDLDTGDMDMDLTGFDESELESIMTWAPDEATGGQTDPDDVPEIKGDPVTKPGDIWILGDHRLMCGDSSTDVPKLMDGKLCDLVFTDPPYGVSIGDKNKMLNTFQPSGRCLRDVVNDSLSPDDLKKILVSVFISVKSVSAQHCAYYVTAPQGGELGMMMMMMMKEAGLTVRHVLLWVKNQPTFSMGRLDYDYKHEPILYTWNKKHVFYGGGEHKTSVWQIDKPRESKLHPTMKPVALVENALLNGSKPGDIILDPFCGSGTAIIAAEKTGRKCYAMELEGHYCDVIVKRWEDFTGEKAHIESR